jgi:hypothetical protein
MNRIEEIARIIEPRAFDNTETRNLNSASRRAAALEKARAIEALTSVSRNAVLENEDVIHRVAVAAAANWYLPVMEAVDYERQLLHWTALEPASKAVFTRLAKLLAAASLLRSPVEAKDNSLRGLIREIETVVHNHFASSIAHGPVQNLLDHLSAIARCHEINERSPVEDGWQKEFNEWRSSADEYYAAKSEYEKHIEHLRALTVSEREKSPNGTEYQSMLAAQARMIAKMHLLYSAVKNRV